MLASRRRVVDDDDADPWVAGERLDAVAKPARAVIRDDDDVDLGGRLAGEFAIHAAPSSSEWIKTRSMTP